MSRTAETVEVTGGRFRLGEWLVEPSLNRLSRGDETIQLELKVMDVLVCLAERAGEVLTRQEIVDRVWATEFISDNTFTHAITEIRTALGDDARNPSFIETIHRRGYRLIAPIEPAVPDEPVVSKVARFPVPERPFERSPYPGLAAFTEDDAEFFFGREDEVSKMWRKLTSRRLLAVIGPSGVGKSSFIRAGVIPAAPEGWGAIICQPGEAPFPALARALVPIFAGDIEATTQLVDISDGDRAVAVVSRWRDRYKQALFVVDQFEELFTLNPPKIQTAFSEFLRRLVDDADVHVLLAMRDDFLFHVHDYPALAPILGELTLLGAPASDSLRRALVEPAKSLDVAFENDDLPGAMVAEVEGERGALPLLAFAMARLWEERDRERRLLTDQSYEAMGGVGGALGNHAEATLKSIGEDRVPIVRELFRNLVTAEGTRAVREWDELLSVFGNDDVRAGLSPARQAAEIVLHRLIDARLLTSFEEEAVEGDGRRRVEVVHESLLSSWPRLIRWQTQDADAAQLRDQLRQAAKTWDDQGRSDDTLWTGAAFREFASWRERYPGGLSDLEEAYADAMTSLASRRRRRRRLAVGSGFVILLTVLAIVGTLWRRSVLETRRAEAQKLLALGQIELETDPTSALAWARASLQVADTAEGRLFALRALSEGPIARILVWDLELGQAHHANFSPDGEWVALRGYSKLKVYGRHGGQPVLVDDYPSANFQMVDGQFDAAGRHLYAYHRSGIARVYSVPDFSEVDQFLFDPPRQVFLQRDDVSFFVTYAAGMENIETRRLGEQPVLQTRIPGVSWGGFDIDASGSMVVYAPTTQRTHVYQQSLLNPERAPRLVAEHRNQVRVLLDPQRRWVATQEGESLTIRLWSLESDAPEELASIGVEQFLKVWQVDAAGNLMVQADIVDGFPLALVWDLRLPSGAEPMTLRSRKAPEYVNGISIDPTGRWVAAGGVNEIPFWSLPEQTPVVFPGDGNIVYKLDFTSDGKALVVPRAWAQFPPTARLESLPLVKDRQRTRLLEARVFSVSAADGDGTIVAAANFPNRVFVIRPDDPEPIVLEGFDDSVNIGSVAYEPERQLVAAAVVKGPAEHKVIRVWDLDNQTVQVLGPTDGAGENYLGGYWAGGLKFLDDGTLLTAARMDGFRRWNLEDGSSELLLAGECGRGISVGPDGRYALVGCREEDRTVRPVLFDLQTHDVTELPQFSASSFLPISGSIRGDVIAVGTVNGAILVGSPSTAEPHVLFGHDAAVYSIAFSPDGRFLASADQSGEIRVWPVPDVSKTPFQSLPYAELMAKLEAMTNLRAVRDQESSTGWTIDVGPFPGWAEVPEW